MDEETITINVAELMKLPPSFCTNFESNKDFRYKNERLKDIFKKYNLFSIFTQINRYPVLKDFFGASLYVPAEVIITVNNKRR